jgi:hypothetical protein
VKVKPRTPAKETFMYYLTLFLLISSLSQASPASQNQPDVEILKFSWRKVPQTIIPSGKKTQEMRNAHIDARIKEERQRDKPDYRLIEELSLQKKNQMPPLDVPKASHKRYEYKVKFKNKGPKQVISLKWMYAFIDTVTGRDLIRHRFESKVKIGSGKEKELIEYTDASPPMVVNVAAKGKDGKMWKEEVIIIEMEYSDGTKWEW